MGYMSLRPMFPTTPVVKWKGSAMQSGTPHHRGGTSELVPSAFVNPDQERITRSGVVTWATHPPAGTARVEAASHAFGALPVSLAERDPMPHEATPGELLAVALGMFLAAELAEILTGTGSPAREIVVEASCNFTGPLSPPDRELAALDLRVKGRVDGLDSARLREAVEEARVRSLRASGTRADLPGALQVELAS
jgi:hypothetical protein